MPELAETPKKLAPSWPSRVDCQSTATGPTGPASAVPGDPGSGTPIELHLDVPLGWDGDLFGLKPAADAEK